MVEVVLEAEEVVDSLEGNNRSYGVSACVDKIQGRECVSHVLHKLSQENGEKIKKWLILTL